MVITATIYVLQDRGWNFGTKVKIEDDEVVLEVRYPLTIIKDVSNYQLSDFKDIRIPIRLGVIYNSVSEMNKIQLEDKDSICISCLINLGIENDLNVDLLESDNGIVFFEIEDENSEIFEETYKFNFVNKYGVKQ